MRLSVRFLVSASLLSRASGLSCQGNSGSAVSWWTLYKQPTGVSYAYVDSRLASNGTETGATTFDVITDSDVGSTKSAPGYTLSPLFETSSSSLAYVAYNDENPNGKTDSVKAHAKGVLAVDPKGLSQSVILCELD